MLGWVEFLQEITKRSKAHYRGVVVVANVECVPLTPPDWYWYKSFLFVIQILLLFYLTKIQFRKLQYVQQYKIWQAWLISVSTSKHYKDNPFNPSLHNVFSKLCGTGRGKSSIQEIPPQKKHTFSIGFVNYVLIGEHI